MPMSSLFPLIMVAGAARPLLVVSRAAPPAPAGLPDWLTTVNVRSVVNGVCRRADTACVVWLTLRPGSAAGTTDTRMHGAVRRRCSALWPSGMQETDARPAGTGRSAP